MKVLIIGQNIGNYGDEAAGLGCVDIFTESEIIKQIGVMYRNRKNIKFCPLPTKSSKVLCEGSFGKTNRIVMIMLCIIHALFPFMKNMSLNKEICSYTNIIKKYDVVVVGPMGVDIGRYKNWYLLFQILIAKQNRIPIYFHLDSIEKSGNKVFDTIAKSVLRKSYMFVRERKSQDYLNSLGIKSKFGIDTAFAMKSSDMLFKENSNKKNRYIVLVLSENLVSRHHSYKEIKINPHKIIMEKIVYPIIRYAKENDYYIHIINHTTDITDVNNLKKLVSESKKNYDKIEFHSINNAYEYENEIKNSCFVVTMRYHGVIISIKNQVPYIALSYENKMNEAAAYSDCKVLCKNLSEIINGTEDIDALLIYVNNNYDIIKHSLDRFNKSLLFESVKYPLRSIENNGIKNR